MNQMKKKSDEFVSLFVNFLTENRYFDCSSKRMIDQVSYILYKTRRLTSPNGCVLLSF